MFSQIRNDKRQRGIRSDKINDIDSPIFPFPVSSAGSFGSPGELSSRRRGQSSSSLEWNARQQFRSSRYSEWMARTPESFSGNLMDFIAHHFFFSSFPPVSITMSSGKSGEIVQAKSSRANVLQSNKSFFHYLRKFNKTFSTLLNDADKTIWGDDTFFFWWDLLPSRIVKRPSLSNREGNKAEHNTQPVNHRIVQIKAFRKMKYTNPDQRL